MALLRSDESRKKVINAFQTQKAGKSLRSYHLPKYQLSIIDVLAEDSGLSKAGVIREIIDEWYELKVKEREAAQ